MWDWPVEMEITQGCEGWRLASDGEGLASGERREKRMCPRVQASVGLNDVSVIRSEVALMVSICSH